MNEHQNTTETSLTDQHSHAELTDELLKIRAEQESTPDELGRDLARDLYQSFRLSQGSAAAQQEIFQLLGEAYVASYPAEILQAGLDYGKHAVDKLTPPANHLAHISGEEQARLEAARGEFEARWNDMKSGIDRAARLERGSEAEVSGTHHSLAERMIYADLRYQRILRPTGGATRDDHESTLREYVLGSRLTGSKELLAIRNRIREDCLQSIDEGTDGPLTQLIAAWEKNHPGQSFTSS